MRKLKFVGGVSASDFVTKRSGHCFSSIYDLVNPDITAKLNLMPSTKGALTKMMSHGNQAVNLCAACGCALCSSGEEWVNGACASRCPPQSLWDAKRGACVDAGFRRRLVESKVPKPCDGTSDICLNNATAQQLDKIKYISLNSGKDLVEKRHAHCY